MSQIKQLIDFSTKSTPSDVPRYFYIIACKNSEPLKLAHERKKSNKVFKPLPAIYSVDWPWLNLKTGPENAVYMEECLEVDLKTENSVRLISKPSEIRAHKTELL